MGEAHARGTWPAAERGARSAGSGAKFGAKFGAHGDAFGAARRRAQRAWLPADLRGQPGQEGAKTRVSEHPPPPGCPSREAEKRKLCVLRGRIKEYLQRGSANWGSRWEGEFADRERREKSAGGYEVSDHGSGSEKVKQR